MTDKEIFTKNFTGSIDELLDHCDKHAVYVNDVIEEKINVILSDEEAISLIKQECHGISDEDAKHVLNEIKIEYVTDMCEKMVEDGLLMKSYDEDGEVLYLSTEKGKKDLENGEKNPKNP